MPSESHLELFCPLPISGLDIGENFIPKGMKIKPSLTQVNKAHAFIGINYYCCASDDLIYRLLR
jgi:hypothetical protein